MRQYFIPILVIIILTGLSLHFYKNTDLYGYDEADYMYAAGKGVFANYVDDHALPLQTFIESGTNLGSDKSKRTELSELIRSSGDISFYRHYHGPLFFYWLNVLHFLGYSEEQCYRAGTLFLLGLTALVLLWAAIRVHGISSVSLLLPVVMLFGCQMNILTDAMLTPHAIYCVTSLLALALLSKFLASKKASDWYAALFVLGLAFLSVEYAVLVAVTFTFCLVVNRKIIFEKYRIIPFIARSVGFLLLVIAALWIGGIIKLTLVKNYLFFAYFTIVRGGEYGSGNFVDAWSRRFTDSPVICIFALATIIYIVCTYKKHTTLLPYLVYPLLVLITSLRNTSISPTYVSSIFPPIFLLSGIALFEMSKGKRVVFPLLITIVIALSSAFFLRPPAIFSSGSGANKINRGLVAFFKTEHRADSNIVVPRIYLPTLHYYNSDKHFAAYAEEFDDSTKIIELLSRTSANGFLCIGRNPERWRTMLQNNYIVKTDSLQYDSHDKDHIIYYELRRL